MRKVLSSLTLVALLLGRAGCATTPPDDPTLSPTPPAETPAASPESPEHLSPPRTPRMTPSVCRWPTFPPREIPGPWPRRSLTVWVLTSMSSSLKRPHSLLHLGKQRIERQYHSAFGSRRRLADWAAVQRRRIQLHGREPGQRPGAGFAPGGLNINSDGWSGKQALVQLGKHIRLLIVRDKDRDQPHQKAGQGQHQGGTQDVKCRVGDGNSQPGSAFVQQDGCSRARSRQNAVSHTAEPTILKERWTSAAHLAFLLVPRGREHGRDAGADVLPHDDADNLSQSHQAGVDEAHHHDRGGG